MTAFIELVAIAIRAMRRAIFWWSLGLAAIVAVTVAFWPAFKGSSGISSAIDQLPGGLVQALGLENFDTPAGYLRGNLYDLLIPLLLAFAAITLAVGQTAGEESNGRLELLLSQPLDHRLVFIARAIAVLIALIVMTAVMAVTQVVVDGLVGLQIDSALLLPTIVLCALLGLLHGGIALAVAGRSARPPTAMGLAAVIAFAGYIVAALFPLVSSLAAWRQLSPWSWAFGGDPLLTQTDPWRYLALALPAIALTALGVELFGKRDIAAA
ncbi:MAG: ABC transporter permease subunit [Candidatus Limnocylindrales bacterium]